VSTVAAIEKHLMHDGFVLRYDSGKTEDGLPAGEGAFLPCTYWLADSFALLGQMDKANAVFERLAKLCNDVGLVSEEYDPRARRLLGNFPQAFTHVGLVNTALNLCKTTGPAKQRRQS
jgi:GH15 family glucan-1,4-alpha-glucosidase